MCDNTTQTEYKYDESKLEFHGIHEFKIEGQDWENYYIANDDKFIYAGSPANAVFLTSFRMEFDSDDFDAELVEFCEDLEAYHRDFSHNRLTHANGSKILLPQEKL